MTNFVIISGAIVGLILLVVIILFVKSPRRGKDSAIDYTAALNYLLAGEKQKAYDKLKEAVRHDTANIDAYVKIGDLLRDAGYIERAIKVHLGLTVRSNLSTYEHIEILKSLIKDYRAGKRYEKALESCESLAAITRHEQWVQELKLEILEEKDDWELAFDVRKHLLRVQGEMNNELLALYKVQAGLVHVRNEKERDGRLKFREAIKLDKNCTPAYLYLGDSYIRENRLSDALTELTKFVETVPKLAYLAFGRIQNLLFERGDYGEIERIYKDLLIKHPDISPIRFALADIFERKGALDAAIDLCERELDLHPESVQARKYLVNYYNRIGKKDEALDIALPLLEGSLNSSTQFTCNVCQNAENEPYWRCPKCHAWNTYVS